MYPSIREIRGSLLCGFLRAEVAQAGSLPYRRLEICEWTTADCQSAAQQTGCLRYNRRAPIQAYRM